MTIIKGKKRGVETDEDTNTNINYYIYVYIHIYTHEYIRWQTANLTKFATFITN